MSVLIYFTPVYLTVPGHMKLTPLQFPRFSLGGLVVLSAFFKNHTFNQWNIGHTRTTIPSNESKQRISFMSHSAASSARKMTLPPRLIKRAEEAGEILARLFKTCIVLHEERFTPFYFCIMLFQNFAGIAVPIEFSAPN